MTAQPAITVLIPTHGRPALLRRTIDSLGECEIPPSYVETVIVENGSRAGAESLVADTAFEHPNLRLRYLHVERANKSHALNEALKTLESGLVVFLDDDVRLDRGILRAYADAARRHSDRAFFGGPVSIDYERTPPDWIVPILPRSARGYELSDRGVMDGEFLGFNWAAFRDDILHAGGFNSDFGPGSPHQAAGQESEMQQRLRGSGFKDQGVGTARVWHYVPRERCTYRFVLNRRYRNGLSVGMRTQGKAVPRYELSRRLGSLAKQALLLNRTGLASVISGFWYVKGARRGWRVANESGNVSSNRG